MGAAALKHKHLKLDQRKIDFAKRYFGVKSEQEAIDQALSLLMEEERLVKALKPLQGILKGHGRTSSRQGAARHQRLYRISARWSSRRMGVWASE